MNNKQELITHLTHLGLNQLEAEVYCDLLAQGPGTGYGIGKRLGKATANVYKAIESLAAKGAVLLEDGERNRLCRALPAETFLANMEAQFQAKSAQARQALAGIESKTADDARIYRFESAEAVFTQARQMLAACQQIIVLDIFPAALEAIRPEIIALAKQGKQVFVQAYAPADLPHCHVVEVKEQGIPFPEIFEGEQLNIIRDGEETLLALLTLDLVSVRQAVWSKSVYLSFLMHVGLMREHNVQEIMNLPKTALSYDTVNQIIAYDHRFSHVGVPGFKTMMSGLSKRFPHD